MGQPLAFLLLSLFVATRSSSAFSHWQFDSVAPSTNDHKSSMIASDDAKEFFSPSATVSLEANAVAILSFDAVAAAGVVTLRCEFRSDRSVVAVNVYRGFGNGQDPMMLIEHVDDVQGDRFEYVDRDVAPGQTYRYQIGIADGDGEFFSPRVAVSVEALSVAIVSFDAVVVDGVVALRSAFRSDLGVETVNVYRGVGTDGDLLTIIERVDGVQGDRFEYVDRDVAPGQTYRYGIGVVDDDGEFFSPIVTVSVGAIAGELAQNRPNPFNPSTTIRFVLSVREDVTLAIYDANGRMVRTLLSEVRSNGAHEISWDGRDDDGSAVSSGVYFYRLRAGKSIASRKMVLLK